MISNTIIGTDNTTESVTYLSTNVPYVISSKQFADVSYIMVEEILWKRQYR